MDKDHTKYDYFTADDVRKEIRMHVMLHNKNPDPLWAEQFCKFHNGDFVWAVYNSLKIERVDFQVNKKTVQTYWRRPKPAQLTPT